MKRIDKDEFIKRSKIHHKENYDYSFVDYKNNRTNSLDKKQIWTDLFL